MDGKRIRNISKKFPQCSAGAQRIRFKGSWWKLFTNQEVFKAI